MQNCDTPPSTAPFTASALFAPNASSTMRFASMMEPTPIESACFGTSDIFLKKRELSFTVWGVSDTRRVRLASELPGSLKAMWPSDPMPSTWRSIPPAFAIAASYAFTSLRQSFARPFRTCVFFFTMSTWSKRFVSMK